MLMRRCQRRRGQRKSGTYRGCGPDLAGRAESRRARTGARAGGKPDRPRRPARPAAHHRSPGQSSGKPGASTAARAPSSAPQISRAQGAWRSLSVTRSALAEGQSVERVVEGPERSVCAFSAFRAHVGAIGAGMALGALQLPSLNTRVRGSSPWRRTCPDVLERAIGRSLTEDAVERVSAASLHRSLPEHAGKLLSATNMLRLWPRPQARAPTRHTSRRDR